jgi:hypothetical protein
LGARGKNVALKTDSGLQYDLLKLSDLFKADRYYIVPKYQRGYAWTNDEIDALLRDLDESWRRYPEEEYLLGQYIVCEAQDKSRNPQLAKDVEQLELIDGQQRFTTMYLFVNVAIRLINEAVASQKLTLEPHEDKSLKTWELPTTLAGLDQRLYTQVKPAQDGDKVLDSVVFGHAMPDEAQSPTQVRLMDAYDQVHDWLAAMETKELFAFTSFVFKKVLLVEISLSTPAHALRVFQKVNNRGLSLDDADLIKSYLFQHVTSDEDYQIIADHWQAATKKLMLANRRSLRNVETLMKLLIGIKTGKYIPKNELYDTWSNVLKEDPKEVKRLAGQLEGAASNLVAISKSTRPQDGHKTDKTFGALDAGFVQPIEVLLAGSHLSPDAYDILLSLVEDRAMLSSWSKEKNNDFEPIMHPWANKVSDLDSHATREEILVASSDALKNFEDLMQRAFLGITSFSYMTTSHRKRLRYVLARANRAMNVRFGLIDHGISTLMRTSSTSSEDKGFDLDHIYPKSESKKDFWVQNTAKDAELGKSSRYPSIHSIGNLILLHPDDNREQSDELPWSEIKLRSLATSQLTLNQVLVPRDSRNTGGTAVDKAVLHALGLGAPVISESWGEEQIDQMARFYWKLISTEIRANFGMDIS